MKPKSLDLFGGDARWKSIDWTSSDDRVRGGKSQSYLECSSGKPIARFYGKLDIKTLGGAGFASQRTTGEDRSWDLSPYDGIQLIIKKSDGKRYTFNIKDELLPKDPDTGREQSTISYEYDFDLSNNDAVGTSTTLFIPWSALKATYRGREKKDATDISTKSIKRLGIMMRSFFGSQEGPFSLEIESVSAVCTKSNTNPAEKIEQTVFEDNNSSTSDIEEGGVTSTFEQGNKNVWVNFLDTSSSTEA